MMVFGLVGPNQGAIERVTRRVIEMFAAGGGMSPEQFQEVAKARGMILGQTEEVVDRLGQLADLGVQEVQFQHLDFDSDEVPHFLASDIVPKVAGL